MFKYILKRVLIFIPTLIAISLITFIISVNAPGDPVEQMLNVGAGSEGQEANKIATEKAYDELRKELGLHLPVFYFSLSSYAMPDTLHRIPQDDEVYMLKRLTAQYGNWSNIAEYYKNLKILEEGLYGLKRDSVNAQALIKGKELIHSLLREYKNSQIENTFNDLEKFFNLLPVRKENQSLQMTAEKRMMDKLMKNNPHIYKLKHRLIKTKDSYLDVLIHKTTWKNYIPVISWYGTGNQYHNWIAGFMQGDFGISYQDKRPVASVIWDALRWTVIISLISIFLTYVIAIPIGIQSAVTKGSMQDNFLTTGLFILYSLPNFWIATLMIMFFGGGDFLDWFPAYGVGNAPEDASFIERFFNTAYHLILPVLCLTYPAFAFLSRQMRGGMINVLNQDFIRTARAKGLKENKVIWKHSFRNSLLPIITLFANVFPLAIAGSFVIEYIFSIPGMGKLAYDSIIARNYPIVYTVVMFASIMTLIGYLVADVLYAMVDPRISYGNKK